MEDTEKKIGTLIKTIAIKRQISPEKWVESLILIYRDKDGNKQSKFIDRAKVPFYILKDTNSIEATNPKLFIEKDKVDETLVYSDLLYREIASRTDSLSYYDRVMFSEGMKSNSFKNLMKHNFIYNSDMDISDRYIKNFYEEYEADKNYKLHKAYFDIEVDLMPNGWNKDSKGRIGYTGFPDEEIAPCPVNIISLIDEKTMKVYCFIVNNSLNESLKEFKSKASEFVTYAIDKIATEDDIILSDIVLEFYDAEEDAIEAFFNKAHYIDPDFINGWNVGFDIKTLQNRLIKLYRNKRATDSSGYKADPRSRANGTICDDKYIYQTDSIGNEAYIRPNTYYIQNSKTPINDRIDYFYSIDSINWMDSMLYYANIRKAVKKESYSLDAIANEELGKEKLDYTGYTIKDLAWKNFWKFCEYNIRDSLLVYLLEKKNLDMDMLERLSEITNTRKEKVFKKTISLKNFVNKYAEENGFVMGNNKNASYGNDSAYYEEHYMHKAEILEYDKKYKELFDRKENFGAYVGDPNINAHCGIKDSTGRDSMFIFENVFDEDFKALYPSIIRAYNLDSATMIGKFFLEDAPTVSKLINEYDYDGLFPLSKNQKAQGTTQETATIDLGPTIVDSLQSQDWNRIGSKYFNLPSVETMIRNFKDKNKS